MPEEPPKNDLRKALIGKGILSLALLQNRKESLPPLHTLSIDVRKEPQVTRTITPEDQPE